MKIVVFGANGPTGRLLTEQALEAGHTVTAVTRHPESFSVTQDNVPGPVPDRLVVMGGDVFDPSFVRRAVQGQDAVLSTLGTPYTRKPISLYSAGTANIVAAMHASGVRRLVCVSSSATYAVADPQGGLFFEKVLQPFFIGVVGKTLYADLRRMETLVTNSDLDWVIMRPSGLFDTPAVTRYQVAEAHLQTRFTSRADLASSMLEQLTSDRYLRKTVAVATTDVKPTMLKLLWREGISKNLQRKPRPVTA